MANSSASKQVKSASGIGGSVALAIFLLWHNYPNDQNQPIPKSKSVPVSALQGMSIQTSSPRRPKLLIDARDATQELQDMLAHLSLEEKLNLGLDVLRTGIDGYAASVRLTNTGNTRLLIFPQKFAFHYFSESATATTVVNPRFLQTTMLEPGHTVEGLVLYFARIDIGAAMRAGQGRISYEDPVVNVSYAFP